MFQSYGIICRKTMGRNKATSRLAPFSEVHPARFESIDTGQRCQYASRIV